MHEEGSQVAHDAVGSIRTLGEFPSQDSVAPDSSKVKSAAASIFGLLDMKSKIDPNDESGTKLDEATGHSSALDAE
ncbi:hypothetical protein Ahy_A06g027197 [Arachis hypogaea]|uniref:Uncharacterized protein n=1 Tax=Arachis hypogaea TaxID=3818 RepID=A0A445CMW2_ARAHY|nr:hypothetical protein Ahy_A06g027197 [Arachis hypogaea]